MTHSTIPPISRVYLETLITQGLWPEPSAISVDNVPLWTELQIREALAFLIAISNGSSQPGLFERVQ
jgi:hypothetical protein